jgi:hypothetical protein
LELSQWNPLLQLMYADSEIKWKKRSIIVSISTLEKSKESITQLLELNGYNTVIG